MSQEPHDPHHLSTDAQERADELRTLAGPVGSEDPAGLAEDEPLPDDTPRPSADVDDVRGEAELGTEADPYELRSMPVEPNPTDDDPASFINP